jgi:arsenite-transporting ATPase
MSAWIGGLIGRRRKVNAMGRMWSNVAGTSASETAAEKDPVLEALEERKARFVRARTILMDPAQTAFFFVVVPERLPIWETGRALTALGKHEIPIGGVLVNQVLPDDLADAFARNRKARQDEYLEMIERELGDWPRRLVYLLVEDPVGTDALRSVGVALWATSETT